MINFYRDSGWNKILTNFINMKNFIIVAFLFLHNFVAPYSFAQDEKEKLGAGEFLVAMIGAPDWEFCSIYGRSLSGAIILPDFDLSDEEAIKIIKEVAKDRGIKVNSQRVLKKKLMMGDSKCQFFAYLGSFASAPIKINTTVVGKIKREQLVMKNGVYVYFDNDKLTAYQTSE